MNPRAPRVLALRRHGGEGSVELLRATPLRERLQRMKAEAPRMRVERSERGRAADVSHPWPGIDAGRDLRDGTVGHTEQNELRLVLRQRDAALGEAGAHRRADATARADDVNSLEVGHGSSSVRIPGMRSVALGLRLSASASAGGFARRANPRPGC